MNVGDKKYRVFLPPDTPAVAGAVAMTPVQP